MRKRETIIFCLPLVLVSSIILGSAAQDLGSQVISISSTGTVKEPPDLAVVLLEVRSTSPLAANALEENNNKRLAVSTKLTELGFTEEQLQFSGNQFMPAGGPYYTGGQRPTGFDVYSTLQIRIPFEKLSMEELGARIASVLDELSKAGASTLSREISMYSLGGMSAVVFTLAEPGEYEGQAYGQAIEKAKPVAEDIAQKMGVKITGIHGVRATPPQMPARPYPTPDLLELRHRSTSPDELTIRTNVVVNFSFE